MVGWGGLGGMGEGWGGDGSGMGRGWGGNGAGMGVVRVVRSVDRLVGRSRSLRVSSSAGNRKERGLKVFGCACTEAKERNEQTEPNERTNEPNETTNRPHTHTHTRTHTHTHTQGVYRSRPGSPPEPRRPERKYINNTDEYARPFTI